MGNEDGDVARTTRRFRFSSLLKKDTVTPAYSPPETIFNVSQDIGTLIGGLSEVLVV